jgi:hypothetical protein
MSTARGRRPVPAWDAPLTIALLVAGVVNDITIVADLRGLTEQLQEMYRTLHIGTYDTIDLANAMSTCGIVAAMAALVIAIGASVPRLRARRLAFWVPLVAATATIVLTTVFRLVAAFGDPDGAAYLQRSLGM